MQLYVGNLSGDTTEADVKEFIPGSFLPQSITIIRDIESGKSRGFAIVKVLNEEGRDEAISRLSGTFLRGRKITLRRMPDTLPGEMEFREWLVEHASEILIQVGVREAQTVLDYGCGPGIFTIPSARIVGDKGKVYAFEARSTLLEDIKEKARGEALSNIITILSDISGLSINLPDKSVDTILVYDVMHEIKNQNRLLQELHRVLKENAILSVFPMHLGTENFMEIVRKYDLFCLRNRVGPPGFKSASEILNLNKC